MVIRALLDYYFPSVSVLCLPFQHVYFLVTPFLCIVQPFPFWSSSFCFPFHLPKHYLLYQSAVFHASQGSLKGENASEIRCTWCLAMSILFCHVQSAFTIPYQLYEN